MRTADYLRMPWTITRSVHRDDGDYIALHVEELPGFVVAGRTDEEVERLFWDALPAFIDSYLAEGEPPPLPNALLANAPQLDLGAPLVVRYHRPMLTTWYPEPVARSVGSGLTQHYASATTT